MARWCVREIGIGIFCVNGMCLASCVSQFYTHSGVRSRAAPPSVSRGHVLTSLKFSVGTSGFQTRIWRSCARGKDPACISSEPFAKRLRLGDTDLKDSCARLEARFSSGVPVLHHGLRVSRKANARADLASSGRKGCRRKRIRVKA